MDFQKLLIKIAKIFDRLRIVYCVTGGYAVSIWGRPRATFDLDIIIKLQTEKLFRLVKSLKSLSTAGYLDENVAKKTLRAGGEFNFIHPESGVKVDFWVVGQDVISLNELKRRIPKKIKNQTIFFISPEDLILSKLRWHKKTESSRQLEDIEGVLKISQSKIDLRYLKRWAGRQSTSKIFNDLLSKSIVK